MEFIINGANITDIPSFYREINALFMADENWEIGCSLDAFNDLLYGGFGKLQADEPVTLIWKDSARSKAALGYEVTKVYYQEKLNPESPFNKAMFRKKLTALENGTGQTYFDIIKEIIAEHPNITLIEQ